MELGCGPRTTLSDHPQDLSDSVRGLLTRGYRCATEEYVMGMHAVHLGERDFQFCLVAWVGRKGVVEVQIWNSVLGQE